MSISVVEKSKGFWDTCFGCEIYIGLMEMEHKFDWLMKKFKEQEGEKGATKERYSCGGVDASVNNDEQGRVLEVKGLGMGAIDDVESLWEYIFNG